MDSVMVPTLATFIRRELALNRTIIYPVFMAKLVIGPAAGETGGEDSVDLPENLHLEDWEEGHKDHV
ncbi:MAG: hypothetical protein Q7V53_03045 [Caldisericota bacterium]|nr:hypothetical protein [Caldisericota bacterium]